jgi:hypothetical protein
MDRNNGCLSFLINNDMHLYAIFRGVCVIVPGICVEIGFSMSGIFKRVVYYSNFNGVFFFGILLNKSKIG